jgi:hypothetical protein
MAVWARRAGGGQPALRASKFSLLTCNFRVSRLLVVMLTLLATGLTHAQQSVVPTDVPAVPIEQEPRHRLVFTNDFVRVLDVMLPPLYVSQNHTHTYDNVAVTILSGIEGAQGQARIGFAGYSRGGYTHVITNPNRLIMRVVAVELRAPDHSASFDDLPQPNHVTVLNNARVHISRVKLDAGQTVQNHEHAAGYVSVVVRGGEGPGTWKWHPSGDPAATLEAGRQALEVVEIEPK